MRCESYCLLGLWLLTPSMAAAFSDPALFTESTLQGGGGGRFFTGSPVDGYSCAVCHQGGTTPRVNVIGLPVEGYDAGVTYQIEVRWSEPQVSHALTLEMVNLAGQGAGEVVLTPAERVGPLGRCEQSPDGQVASYLLHTPTRSIVGISDCGAGSLLFNFTAPGDDQIAFAATIVRSDSSGTAEGDGVLELSKILRRRGSVTTTRGSTSCAAAGPRVTSGPWWLMLMPMLVYARLSASRCRTRASRSSRSRSSHMRATAAATDFPRIGHEKS